MKVYRETIDLQSEKNHPTFHDVTKDVKAALERSGITNGIVVVYSHHTTLYSLEYFFIIPFPTFMNFSPG